MYGLFPRRYSTLVCPAHHRPCKCSILMHLPAQFSVTSTHRQERGAPVRAVRLRYGEDRDGLRYIYRYLYTEETNTEMRLGEEKKKHTKSNFICPVALSLAYIPNVEAVCIHLSSDILTSLNSTLAGFIWNRKKSLRSFENTMWG